MPQKSGPLHDNRVPPDGQCLRSIEPQPNTSHGGHRSAAMTQASDPPPTEGQTHAMEVDDEGTHSHPASPISTAEDDLLMGGGVVGVESDLAHLTASSPRNPNSEGEEAST